VVRSQYITHARTLEELRAEFLSDLSRRQNSLDARIKTSTSAALSARLALARSELDDLWDFWNRITIPAPTSDLVKDPK